jgi:hypothetical protein
MARPFAQPHDALIILKHLVVAFTAARKSGSEKPVARVRIASGDHNSRLVRLGPSTIGPERRRA